MLKKKQFALYFLSAMIFLVSMSVNASMSASVVSVETRATLVSPVSSADPLQRFLTWSPVASGYEIIINIPAMTLVLYHNGMGIASFPIAIGTSVAPSQLGATYIINKVLHPTYYPPDWAKKGLKPIPPGPDNPVGTMWMGLERKGYGIHGTNNPASIGTAASSGCIRMYNADVERLAAIVPIGTPVNFVYETLLIGVDTITNWPFIQVYKDVYHLKSPSINTVLAQLRDIGITGIVDQELLAVILKAPTGKPEPIPMVVEVSLNVGNIAVTGYYDGRFVYAPIKEVTMQVSDNVSLEAEQFVDVRTWGGKIYAPITELARALGLLVGSDGHSIISAQLYGNGTALAGRLWVSSNEILLPLEPLAAWLNELLEYDANSVLAHIGQRPVKAVIHAGHLYASQDDVLQAFPELTMQWCEQQTRLEIYAN